jgi:ribosomal protein L37AE/L43A
MSTTITDAESVHHAGSPACPNCGSLLDEQGERNHEYWSCRPCNLVFLA